MNRKEREGKNRKQRVGVERKERGQKTEKKGIKEQKREDRRE